MKKHKMIERLFTLTLALVMVLTLGLTLAVPARAKDEGAGNSKYNAPFQIDIKPNDNVSKPAAETPANDPLVTRFWAYQIFTGRISGSYENDDDEKSSGYRDGTVPDEPNPPGQDIVTPKANQLADVKWGASINPDKINDLLGELKKDKTLAKDVKVTQERLEELKDIYLDSDSAKANPNLSGYKNTLESGEGTEEAFNSITLGDLFSARIGDKTGADAAALVAKVLTDFTDVTGNTAMAQAFTNIVARKYPVENDDAGKYMFLLNSGGAAKGAPGGGSYDGAYAVSRWDKAKEHWSIGNSDKESNTDDTNLSGGYYLIRDKYSENSSEVKGKASSGYILAVFGNNTIYPKADIPTADKTIVSAPASGDKGGGFEIGKEITYQVKGTLPEDYDTAYKKYFFRFTDTMDEGLTYLGGGKTLDGINISGSDSHDSGTNKTFKDVLRVYVKVYNENGKFDPGNGGKKYDYYLVELDTNPKSNGTKDYEYDDDGYDAYTGAGYWLNVTENTGNAGNQTKIEVTIPDLKKLKGKKVNPTSGNQWSTGGELVPLSSFITSSSEIYVQYTAALNEKAVVDKKDGNMNSVDLEYSNNPDWQGKGKPDTDTTETENKTHVYDFGVAINKYDGSKGDYEEEEPDKNVMADVGFALTKSEKWYPYFTENNGDKAVGWVSEEDVLAYLAHFGIEKKEDAGEYLRGDVKLPKVEAGDGSVSPISAAGHFLASKNDGENVPKAVDKMTAYAILRKVIDSTGSDDKYHYAIAGWLPEVELETVLSDPIKWADDTGKVYDIKGNNPAIASYIGFGFGKTQNDSYYLAIQTDKDGCLRIEGMRNGIIYYLNEVITPDGYDTIDPISIEFTAEYDEEDGTLKKASAKVKFDSDPDAEDEEDDDAVIYDVYDKTKEESNDGWLEGYTELAVTSKVPNYPAGYLPGTGGMGTTLFYIAGIVLLAGAALLLIFSNVKKKSGQHVR